MIRENRGDSAPCIIKNVSECLYMSRQLAGRIPAGSSLYISLSDDREGKVREEKDLR